MSTPDVGTKRRARLAAARLYMVCDSKPGGRELTGVLRAAIAGGVDIVQLRDKRISDEELTEVVRTAHTICEREGVLLIVNDRPRVALAAGADGVHVGQEDMPVAQVRELVGPDVLIGLSTHAPTEVDAATAGFGAAAETKRGGANVDYIGVGPVYATPTKPRRPAVGLELVRYAAEHSRLPFFAIGGIDAGNVEAVVEAGARRVAVVRAIADAADPEQAARDSARGAWCERAGGRACHPLARGRAIRATGSRTLRLSARVAREVRARARRRGTSSLAPSSRRWARASGPRRCWSPWRWLVCSPSGSRRGRSPSTTCAATGGQSPAASSWRSCWQRSRGGCTDGATGRCSASRGCWPSRSS